jgi:hypothetical protein
MLIKNLYIKSFLPALIFSFCILEMSLGLTIEFYTVWGFYFYFIWSIFNINSKYIYTSSSLSGNNYLLFLYFLSCLIYVVHHLSGNQLYDHSTAESFNILWWSVFGAILIFQVRQGVVDYEIFTNYVRKIVFFGCVIAAALGLIKYYNILSGNFISSYYHNDSLLIGSSLNSDYNVYSFGLSIGALLSLDLFTNDLSKKHFKTLYILAIGVIVLSILLSGSRRGVLMSGFIIYFLLNIKLIKNAKKQSELVLSFFIPIILILLINTYWETISFFLLDSDLLDQSISRVLTLKDELEGENERTNRFLWSFDVFINRNFLEAFFGGGFDYLRLMGIAFSGETEDNPHNYLLSSLLYGGIIGFVLMIFLTFELIFTSFKYHRIWYPIILLLIFFNLTSSNSLFSSRIFPTLLLLMSLKFISNKNRNNLDL